MSKAEKGSGSRECSFVSPHLYFNRWRWRMPWETYRLFVDTRHL